MSVGVSAPVLREVGALMGLPLAEGSVDGLARELLRRAEQAGVVDVLVGHLAERAPLVEWPEPLDGGGEKAGPEQVIETVSADATETTAPEGETIPAEGAPEQAPEAADTAANAPSGPVSAWIPPGHADPRQKAASSAKGGVDPRIFVLVALLMLGAGAVAFAAGRVSAGDGDDRPARPAAHAAAALQVGLGAVARTCKVSAEPPLGTAVLQAAYDVCGVKPQRERRPAGTQVDLGDEPAAPAAPVDPGPLVPKPTQTELPASTTGCVKRCSAEHNGCRSGCGPEPRESGGYAIYQGCLAKCLTASSSCRLACESN